MGPAEWADGCRGLDTFPVRWLERAGLPPGRQYSEERRRWIARQVELDDVLGHNWRGRFLERVGAENAARVRLVDVLGRRDPSR